MDIKITVRRKLPICGDVAIVCNNSDYTVIWELDEEWDGYDTKTMRTVYKDGTYADTVFTGDTVALPVVTVSGTVKIGLYAGDIRTSRAALIRAFPSITSDGGAPAAPSEDAYNQIMERMAQLETPDWNQNDPDKKDYVKNRTHWKTPARKVILPECDVIAEGEDGNAHWQLELSNDTWDFLCDRLYEAATPSVFRVQFDGAEYRCELLEWTAFGGSTWGRIGNISLTGVGENTGEPFCIAFDEGFAVASRAGTHTVSIECLYDEVHPLGPEYMLQSIPCPTVVQVFGDGTVVPFYRTQFHCVSSNSDPSEVIFDEQQGKFRLSERPAVAFGTVSVRAPKGLNLSVGDSEVFYSTGGADIESMRKLGSNSNIVVRIFISGKYGDEPYDCLATRAPSGSAKRACGGLCYHTDGKLYGMTAELNSAQTQVAITIKRLM